MIDLMGRVVTYNLMVRQKAYNFYVGPELSMKSYRP